MGCYSMSYRSTSYRSMSYRSMGCSTMANSSMAAVAAGNNNMAMGSTVVGSS